MQRATRPRQSATDSRPLGNRCCSEERSQLLPRSTRRASYGPWAEHRVYGRFLSSEMGFPVASLSPGCAQETKATARTLPVWFRYGFGGATRDCEGDQTD